jgi:NAD(P)-dependent dehydrogenase (short-subunit alcohol dehydrogenase family)
MSRPSFDYTGKNVFVFGGTSGINLGIAHGFARAGANLSVASRNPEKVEAAKIAIPTLRWASHSTCAIGMR